MRFVAIAFVLALLVSGCKSNNTEKARSLAGDADVTEQPSTQKAAPAKTSEEAKPKGEIELGLEGDYGQVEVEEGVAETKDEPAEEEKAEPKACNRDSECAEEGKDIRCVQGFCMEAPEN